MVTDRAFMRATLIVFLSSAFLAVGCKQGLGDRCVQNSDCSTGICVGASVQGGHCAATSTVGTETGSGGSGAETGSGGSGGGAGAGGEGGGAAGQGAAAGATGQGGTVQDGSASDAQGATDATVD